MADPSPRTDRRLQRRAAGELLRRMMTPDGADPDTVADLLAATADDVLLGMARYHGVAGWLYEGLRDHPAARRALVDGLAIDHEAAVRAHLRGLWQLARVAATLDGAGLRWVVVKGPVLVDLLYGPLGRRWYHDLDVLVHPATFVEALDALQSDGAALLDRNWPLLRRDERAQLHLALSSGIQLDLHWDLINVHRRRMSIDTDAILERRMVVDLGGLTVPTLDPVDSVIHLAVHAALSGGDKLMWLKDIERAVVVRPPDWDAVTGRSRAWGVAPAVGLELARAVSVLSAPVPGAVLVELLGRRRLRIVRAIDDIDPLTTSAGGPRPGRALARAIGHGIVGGGVVLLLRAARHFDPREPARSSPFTPAGHAVDRDRYLHDVTAVGGSGR